MEHDRFMLKSDEQYYTGYKRDAWLEVLEDGKTIIHNTVLEGWVVERYQGGDVEIRTTSGEKVLVSVEAYKELTHTTR
jgi:hypothetical protein